MSYVTSLYHLVFATRCRKPVINNEYRQHLYGVIGARIRKNKCMALAIDGVNDHVHILLSLHPGIALADLVRDIKSASSVWAKESGMFPLFDGWEREYGAFSLSNSHKDAVCQYINNQQDHHSTASLDDEFERLVMKAGLQIYRPE